MAYSDTDKQTFLDALAKCGIVSDALGAAGIKSRMTINRWREEDEAFSAAYDEALETAADTLEAEARRRAVEGVATTKYTKDGQAYDEVRYSDPLLIALLKANKPDKFADRSKTELTNPDGSFKPENEVQAAARVAALLDAARQRQLAAPALQLTQEDPLFE